MPRKKTSKKNSKRKNKSSRQNVVKFGPAKPQEESRLMQLPQELRHQIYSHLFSSTRFASGERSMARIGSRRISSAPHGLTFLLSCRQAYFEIGKAWLSQVLFCFETPKAMLDKLAKIPLETRSMIRHVRVSGHPLMICFEDDDDDEVYCRTSQALKLLPGLKLERLTVLGPEDAQISYDTLDLLVKHGDGWKELHYISHTSAFIAYKRNWFTWNGDPEKDRYLCEPQPTGWQRNIEDRDGSHSGASVTIYRSTNPRCFGSVMHAATRVKFTQTLSPGQDVKNFSKREDSQLMAPGEREKEMLVVVKRGRGVDYEEKQGSQYLSHGDIRSDFPGKTWMEINSEQERIFADSNDSLSSDDEDEDEALVDDYSRVDDYVWPPLYFSTR